MKGLLIKDFKLSYIIYIQLFTECTDENRRLSTEYSIKLLNILEYEEVKFL